ncbi:MAG: ankyrin repeat domain-containing protein [Campylobacterota bacterium]|nr:ankyrin repeat domain-containing protein [Campylobacterota bacterium]
MNTWLEILKNDDYLKAMRYIKDGADVNEANENGETVLALALRYKCDIELIMYIINNGADIFDYDDEGVSIFDMAVTYDNIEIVKYLIEKGVDVNQTYRRSRFTSLMAAACYGRVEIAKLLLDNGADQNVVDSKGFNAIDFARKMNKKSILEILDYDKDSPRNTNYAR